MTPVPEHVVATYKIELISSFRQPGFRGSEPVGIKFREHYLRELEENITTLLPDGFRVVIKEETASE